MAPRADKRIFDRLRLTVWILEIIECICSIIVLAITGSAREGMLHDLHLPRVPPKLDYNIALVS